MVETMSPRVQILHALTCFIAYSCYQQGFPKKGFSHADEKKTICAKWMLRLIYVSLSCPLRLGTNWLDVAHCLASQYNIHLKLEYVCMFVVHVSIPGF